MAETDTSADADVTAIDTATDAEAAPETVEPAADVKPAAKRSGTRKSAAKSPAKRKDRIERYEALKGDGTVVTVERNIDTGATSIVED
ncbi:hypothetical protein [Gordonia sihwensis]|uniref:Uncharacterized protein n=1 Tax=Gordonia sihwensis NBRC 108236 TaxID=1223544 RepID=L7LGV9_9ACTN|nr:hypothetical protein [Gordonia sihwensis]GAC59337.1 hypothetical protein GSI01S_01_03040 [Gordonia sihwensis NBRC 108236]